MFMEIYEEEDQKTGDSMANNIRKVSVSEDDDVDRSKWKC